MSRKFEGRIAKLEASAVGKGEFILAQNREDETLEEFNRRVDALVREAKARGSGSLFLLKVTVAPKRKSKGEGVK
jgi:hypothetical protein